MKLVCFHFKKKLSRIILTVYFQRLKCIVDGCIVGRDPTQRWKKSLINFLKKIKNCLSAHHNIDHHTTLITMHYCFTAQRNIISQQNIDHDTLLITTQYWSQHNITSQHNIILFPWCDHGLGESLAQHENETHPFLSSKHHQQWSILYSNTSCTQSNMVAVWLTEESRQEMGGASPRTIQLPGTCIHSNTPATNHT